MTKILLEHIYVHCQEAGALVTNHQKVCCMTLLVLTLSLFLSLTTEFFPSVTFHTYRRKKNYKKNQWFSKQQISYFIYTISFV